METVPFDASRFLDSEEMIAEFLSQVLEDNDMDLLLSALNAIARAKGMALLAKETGLSRESLYKALQIGSHPRFETISLVISALGLRLQAVPESIAKAASL